MRGRGRKTERGRSERKREKDREREGEREGAKERGSKGGRKKGRERESTVFITRNLPHLIHSPQIY